MAPASAGGAVAPLRRWRLSAAPVNVGAHKAENAGNIYEPVARSPVRGRSVALDDFPLAFVSER